MIRSISWKLWRPSSMKISLIFFYNEKCCTVAALKCIFIESENALSYPEASVFDNENALFPNRYRQCMFGNFLPKNAFRLIACTRPTSWFGIPRPVQKRAIPPLSGHLKAQVVKPGLAVAPRLVGRAEAARAPVGRVRTERLKQRRVQRRQRRLAGFLHEALGLAPVARELLDAHAPALRVVP